VVASGGAGVPEHLFDVFDHASADAALIASMAHFGTYTIRQIKDYQAEKRIPLRMTW
jgi:cyclase